MKLASGYQPEHFLKINSFVEIGLVCVYTCLPSCWMGLPSFPWLVSPLIPLVRWVFRVCTGRHPHPPLYVFMLDCRVSVACQAPFDSLRVGWACRVSVCRCLHFLPLFSFMLEGSAAACVSAILCLFPLSPFMLDVLGFPGLSLCLSPFASLQVGQVYRASGGWCLRLALSPFLLNGPSGFLLLSPLMLPGFL